MASAYSCDATIMISISTTKISNNWLYFEDNNSQGEKINLPHANKLIPYNYFDEKMYQFISRYEKVIAVSAKRTLLRFDGVMTAFTLTVNGTELPECRGGYIPHMVEITDYVKPGENTISVLVDSTERSDIPPFGYVVDYLTYGGIYRDVWQLDTDNCFIENCFMEYEMTGEKAATVNPIVVLNATEACEIDVTIELCGATVTQKVAVKAGAARYNITPFVVNDLHLWDIDDPHMYAANIVAGSDRASVSVGFRTIVFAKDKLTLNGKKINIVGLNRHQSYPYAGYAMPKRCQEKDAIILKNLGLNTVRTSHYPQSTFFLDECDRQGLLVFEEVPGWQYVSEEQAWRDQVLDDVTAMIERDYNHPSIITWGVRINESQDDHELYTRTNALAHKLDKTRKTSGIRCIERSELLEDIYTMNDFMHDGSENILRTQSRCTGKDEHVPYVITEFCGHMFPTKRFDQEQHIVEHALRHGRVQSYASQKDEYLGAIGWCAFDYNTHYDFGSGDRICYHGVMDMFRIEKFAAATYKAQSSKEHVLEPLTYWARGERDRGNMFPIHVFTNLHEIEVKLDGKTAFRTKRQFWSVDPQMQFLKNPPILVSLNLGEWGAHLVDVEFIGYENGEPVLAKKYLAAPTYDSIVAASDDQTLLAAEFDATRVVIKGIDKIGNPLPYLSESVSVEVSGDIEVIGPKTVMLIGGQGAFWVRTKVDAKAGKAAVHMASSCGYTANLSVELE